jgi:hypothetical protein
MKLSPFYVEGDTELGEEWHIVYSLLSITDGSLHLLEASCQSPLSGRSPRSTYTKKGRATFNPAYGDAEDEMGEIYLFRSLRLPYPTSPINPEPRSSMVAGSGTGTCPSLYP